MRTKLVTAAVALLGFAGSTLSEPITFVASGPITWMSPNAASHFSLPVNVGDEVQFTYTFESTTTGTPLSSNYYRYFGAVTQVSVAVSNTGFSFAPSAPNHNIDVQDDNFDGTVYSDVYDVHAYDSVTQPFTAINLSLAGRDTAPINALTSTDLPLTPPSPQAFLQAASGPNVAWFTVDFTNNDVTDQLQVAVTTITIVTGKTPQQLLTELAQAVVAMNVQAGISNALDSKLDNALNALDSAKKGDKATAINMLNAFIASVNAQRGKALTEAQATQLVNGANAIILAIGT